MGAIAKNFVSIIFINIMLFSVTAMAAAITDLREDDSWLSARKIEWELKDGALDNGVKRFEVNYISHCVGGKNSCANTAPKVRKINRPDQIIDLMNSMPVAEIIFSIDGYNDSGLVKSWLFLAKKSIKDRVATSNYHRNYSEKSFSDAKSTMIDQLLGTYDRRNTIASYHIEYSLPNSKKVRFLTATSLAELSTMLDQLAAGHYELKVRVIQTNGIVADHLVTLNKTRNDVVAKSATLQITWEAPYAREDGSALSGRDIAGYEIYYTVIAPDNTTIDQRVEISTANETQYTLRKAPAGQYYFAVATVDSAGVKSHISNIVKAVVN